MKRRLTIEYETDAPREKCGVCPLHHHDVDDNGRFITVCIRDNADVTDGKRTEACLASEDTAGAK